MGGMTQRPWTPTKRRGPIAAEYSSPGPACVTLPPLIGNLNFYNLNLSFVSQFIEQILNMNQICRKNCSRLETRQSARFLVWE